MIALVRLSAGLIGWAVAFCLIYGLHGIGCAGGWDRASLLGLDVQRAALAGAWIACMALTLAIALYLSRTRVTMLDRAAMATGWTGFVATIVSFLPVIAVPSCL